MQSFRPRVAILEQKAHSVEIEKEPSEQVESLRYDAEASHYPSRDIYKRSDSKTEVGAKEGKDGRGKDGDIVGKVKSVQCQTSEAWESKVVAEINKVQVLTSASCPDDIQGNFITVLITTRTIIVGSLPDIHPFERIEKKK